MILLGSPDIAFIMCSYPDADVLFHGPKRVCVANKSLPPYPSFLLFHDPFFFGLFLKKFELAGISTHSSALLAAKSWRSTARSEQSLQL